MSLPDYENASKWWGWFSRRPGWIRVLTGIGIILVILLSVGLTLYDRVCNVPKLEKDIRDRDVEIQRLETQLVPFKTVALERYPGNEAQALNRLAKELSDLELRLEASLQKINSFEVSIRTIVLTKPSADSTSSKKSVLVFGDNPAATVHLQLQDGSSRDESFYLTEGTPTISGLGNGRVCVEYHAKARPGSWVFDRRLDQLSICTQIQFALYGIQREPTKTESIIFGSVSFTVYANGKPVLCLEGKRDDEFVLPDAGYLLLKLEGRFPFPSLSAQPSDLNREEKS